MTGLHQEITKLRAKLDVANATIADMRQAEADRVEPFIGVAGLNRSEAKLIAAIARGGRVSFERVYATLYSHLDEPRALKTIKVTLCNARAKLKQHGVIVQTIWGIGWEIDKPNRFALERLVAA